jgi:bifunctional non-homologous end joining protein LigD
MPEWVEPMAATLTQERFTGPEWSFERKIDGIRLLAFKRGREVSLLSRTRRVQDLPPIASAVATLPVRDVILDGELSWAGTTYHVFDIVWLDGCDLRPLALEERRRLLNGMPLRPPLHRLRAIEDEQPWERAAREGWEGVIAKRRGSTYEGRRSPHWLKMKVEATQEFVVGGFTDPLGRRVGLGALLVGYYEGPDLVFAGKVGTGLDTRLLLSLREQLEALETPTPPFAKGKGLPRKGAHWTRPEVVVQASFLEWTVHGKLRHSRLVGVRTDKAPRDVVREGP